MTELKIALCLGLFLGFVSGGALVGVILSLLHERERDRDYRERLREINRQEAHRRRMRDWHASADAKRRLGDRRQVYFGADGKVRFIDRELLDRALRAANEALGTFLTKNIAPKDSGPPQ